MKKLVFILAVLISTVAFSQNKSEVQSTKNKTGFVEEKSGNQTFSGNYVNGKKEGCWVQYNEKNLLRGVTEYKNDKKNGIAVTLNAQGSLELEEHFVDDVYQGEIRKYLRGNYLSEVATYEKGVMNGEFKRYYSDKPGVLMEEATFVNGLKQGISKWYSNDGKILAQYTYDKGKFNGKNTQFHPNGNVMSEEEFENDTPVGTYKEYFDDGTTLKLTGKFTNGKRNGEWIEYNQSGQTVSKMKYVNGELK